MEILASGSAWRATQQPELWRRVAGLLEHDVGDVDPAIAACVSILDENPEDDQALETLARLYEQQGRHRDRLEIVDRRLLLRKPNDAERVLLRKRSRRSRGAARRSGRRAGSLARGAGARRRGRRGPGRWSASWPPAPRGPAPGGRAILEPIYEKVGAFAELADRPDLRRGRVRRAGAPRRPDAAGGARRDPAGRHRGRPRHDGAGGSRRANRARAAGLLDAYERLPVPSGWPR